MHMVRNLLAGSLLIVALAAPAPQSSLYAAVNTTPPKLEVVIPRSTNVDWVDLFGQSEPGTKVQVNGVDAPTDEKGAFSFRLRINQYRTVTVTATDAAGNQSVASEIVTLDATVDWLRVHPHVGMTGYAPLGTKVGRWGGKGVAVESILGLFRWRESLKLGQNNFMLEFDPPNAARYYRQYVVWRPLDVDLPTKTNIAKLRLPARLLAGWKLSMDGRPVTTDAEGRFTFAADLVYGINAIKLALTSPEGSVAIRTVQVAQTEVSLDPSEVVDDHWIFQWDGPEEGTLFMTEGVEPFFMPPGRYGSWKLPVKRGANDLRMYYISPNGDTGFYWYQFEYQP